nr:CYTH and CHAD domain-containing protein [Kineococcus siccus]
MRDGDGGEHRLEAVYFDTEDHRLAQARVTLRRRSGGADEGWHLKLPAADGARQERRVPLGRAVRTVPAALRRTVEDLTGGAALVPVAQLTTLRGLQHLLDASGRVLLERADDRVEARLLLPREGSGQAAGASTSWREVEVEVVGGDRELLSAVDAGLRAAGLRRSASSSKLARVLDGEAPAPDAPDADAPDAVEAADVVEPVRQTARAATGRRRLELSRRSRAGDVVLSHLAEQVDQVLDQDPRVRADVPDSVHRMRVATRRLRSALTTFSPLFASSTRPLRGELTWLAGELGAARDAEVLRDRVSSAVADLDADPHAPEAGPAVEREVRGQLDGAYRAAHDELLTALASERYERLLDALQSLLADPDLAGKAARPAVKVLPRRVSRAHRELAGLLAQASDLDPGAERDELLHEARKAAKRVRYAAEAVASVFGKDATRFARAVTDLQEVLGEHQDSVVARQELRALAGGDVSPAVAFAYGRLFAQEQGHAAASEEDLADAWDALRAKRLHRWLR